MVFRIIKIGGLALVLKAAAEDMNVNLDFENASKEELIRVFARYNSSDGSATGYANDVYKMYEAFFDYNN